MRPKHELGMPSGLPKHNKSERTLTPTKIRDSVLLHRARKGGHYHATKKCSQLSARSDARRR
ncbi:hypothetical protein D9M68_521230 [compost metagenome]